MSPALERVRELNAAGRYQEAESAARSLLARAEAQSRETLDVAHILDELAFALRLGTSVLGDEALAVCERSLAIKSRLVGDQDPDYALSLHNLGTLYAYRGDYSRARTTLDLARVLRERTLGADHPEVASTLIPLSHVLREEGDAEGARDLLEHAVFILEKSSSGSELVKALLSLGYSWYDSGDYGRGASTWERALDTATRVLPSGHPHLGICHQNLGALYTETGDYELARKHYEQALRIRRSSLAPNHPLLATSLEAIGYLDELRSEYLSARRHYSQAVEIQERVLGKSHPQTARLWTRLAGTELRTGARNHASELLRRALAVQESTLGLTHPDLAWTLDGLAAFEESKGHLDLALRYYERARDIRIGAYGAIHPDVSLSMVLLSRVHSKRGDRASALDAALESATINIENLASATQALAERHALAYAAIQSTGHDLALSLLSEGPTPSVTEIERVWGVWVRSRNVVLDEMVRRHRFLGSSQDSSLAATGSRLADSRRRLSHLLVRGLENERVESYKAKVDSLRGEVERLERRIASWGGQRRGTSSVDVDYVALASAMPDHSALVAYCWYGPTNKRRYAAFVQRSGGEPKFVPLGDAAPIEDRIASWLRLASGEELGGPGSESSQEAACTKAGRLVRAAIWDGVQAHLGDATRVFVVLDGALYRVNLAALPTNTGYLVETGPLIHYLPAERDLLEERSSRTGRGLLALGGVDFNSGVLKSSRTKRRGPAPECIDLTGYRFEPLPSTLQEVNDIAALWDREDGVLLRTGVEASEAVIRREAPGRRVVHLATHGFFLDGECVTERKRGARGISTTIPAGDFRKPPPASSRLSRFLSGLALSGANAKEAGGADDGIFTAEEIASLNLKDVEWVVLSACDTGLGRPQAGEGILGMRRAFQIAGAETVIMSLWAVEDAATRSWMLEFYRGRLKEHLGTAEAVRKASIRVLRERRAQARSTLPFYWAGFVASGHWN